MDETMKNTTTKELNEQVDSIEDEITTVEEASKDPLKEAIEEQLRKVQRQNLLIGAQTCAHVILQKITAIMDKPGERTMNDYKRLIKDIENFCRVGVSRKVNQNGETEPEESDKHEGG